jgi:hydroxypyruvate isomerase
MKLSACIEWLFSEASDDFANRIRLAKTAGLDAVEFWFWSNKDIDAVEAALKETGISLSGFVAEPMIALTDPANHAAFLAGLATSVKTAQRPATILKAERARSSTRLWWTAYLRRRTCWKAAE